MTVYLIVVYLVESAWCLAGLKAIAGPQPFRLSAGLRLGLVRTLLGYGSTLVLLQSLPVWSEPAVYSILLPLRWLAWSIVASLIAGESFGKFDPAMGSRRRLLLWQSGGVLLCCLTDVFGLLEGFSVERLWV